MLEVRLSIAANTGALDLSDCGLTEIPSAVFSLTGLSDLSLAGNRISHIPPDIQNLRDLRRLGLAGNLIQDLPPEIRQLSSLEGLWLHGNLLHDVPEEIGQLKHLRMLALAGNRLRSLPESISLLTSLQVLSVAGNSIAEIPEGVGNLGALRVLAAFGNNLSQVPDSISRLHSLQDLWLQGNRLQALPHSLAGLQCLRQCSLSDNAISHLSPSAFQNLNSLETLWLYGNRLEASPSLSSCTNLKSVWLESNPGLEASHITKLMSEISFVKTVGVDDKQADGISAKNITACFGSREALSIGRIAGTGRAAGGGGYFKVQPWNQPSGAAEGADLNGKLSSSSRASRLVVAFGSAPGVPNWGGLLRKVKKAMSSDANAAPFDVLFVVDPTRSWFAHGPLTGSQEGEEVGQQENKGLNARSRSSSCGGGSGGGDGVGAYYREELVEAVKGYERVVMIGDSMGGSASLLFSPLASSVLAFCPQVDLTEASIRPGKSHEWLLEYRKSMLGAVERWPSSSGPSSAREGQLLRVHCGNWKHDREQARLLEPLSHVEVTVHNVDSHRLAKDLDSRGALVPLVKREIEG